MKVYLDNAATTRPYEEVVRVMSRCALDEYANASGLHSYARDARAELEGARDIAARFINADPREIFFTSGATESNNWAITGAARKNRKKGKHLITTAIEHHSVLETFEALEKEGFEVTYLGVDGNGSIDIRKLKDAIRDDTVLVSVMTANNEIGTIEPIKEIGEIVRKKGIIFHTDAVQAMGKTEVDVKKMNCDLLSASAHKFHGPKGVGFLYIRDGVRIENLEHGGNQERARRPGTYNTPAICGLGEALKLTERNMAEDTERMRSLRDLLIEKTTDMIEGCTLNGEREKRLCNNVSLSLDGVDSESLLYRLDMKGIACSTGSACMADSGTSSHVIKALGKDEANLATVRLSLSRYTTEEEVEYAAKALRECAEALRERKRLV